MGRRFIRALLCFFLCFGGLSTWAADPNKTLRFAFRVAETTFDPAQVSDLYSVTVIEGIFDTLLTYDYLARPAKLVPSTAESLPEITQNGTVYTIRVKPGIYFAEDPVFKGRRRELVAADFVYSYRRHFDPKWRSPNLYLIENKVVGADEAMQAARTANRYDYDRPVEGLEAVDRYTLRIRLKQPDYTFIYVLANPNFSAVAREVVEAYGDNIGAHPVGSGAYRLKEWRRSSRIVLEANPDYRTEYFTGQPAADDSAGQAILAAMRGKKLPIIGRVEIYIVEETQPRWLAFLNEEHDFIERLPEEFINVATPGSKLSANLARHGVQLNRLQGTDLTFTYFNMDDLVVGGYTPEKVALRRAITLGYNSEEEIALIWSNQAIRAEGPISPGVAGYDPNFRSPTTEYNLPKARALLDMFGYVDRDGDGYRDLPDGRPLSIERASTPTLLDKQRDELWKKSLESIGIRMTLRKQKWPDLLKESNQGKLQMWSVAWTVTSPDGEFFLTLLYGPNAGQANRSRFRLPAYDELFRKAKTLPDSPERTALYQEMAKLALAYAPMQFGTHRIITNLSQRWVIGYQMHPFVRGNWKYLDIDLAKRAAAG